MSFRQFVESSQAREVVTTIYQRVQKNFDAWLREYQDDPQAVSEILNDPEELRQYLNEFTAEYFDFEIREDGLIEPERITPQNTRIIGSLPIVVYHHSTDAIEDKVSHMGLLPVGQQGVKSSNPHLNSNSGVYVTTDYSSNAVRGYHHNAVAAHGGNPRSWAVRTTIDQLRDDPDDTDLGWSQGRQFVLPQVSPKDIIE